MWKAFIEETTFFDPHSKTDLIKNEYGISRFDHSLNDRPGPRGTRRISVFMQINNDWHFHAIGRTPLRIGIIQSAKQHRFTLDISAQIGEVYSLSKVIRLFSGAKRWGFFSQYPLDRFSVLFHLFIPGYGIPNLI